MWTRNGRRREMGLGSYLDVDLAEAREQAEKCRRIVRQGGDPILERKKIAEPGFLQCAQGFLETKQAGWTSAKHAAGWRLSLLTHAQPLHAFKVSQIGTPDVLRILKPLWQSKPETASRLRGRVEAVLDYAKAMGWRDGENPAQWRGNLKILLPAQSRQVRHHPAMAVSEMPGFMVQLRSREALAARLLEFIILTACRSGEARGTRWAEIDFEAGLWTVPAERMKTGKEHVVPLSKRALSIVQERAESDSGDLVFSQQPGNGKRFSVNATRALLHRMGRPDVTTHGFRSTFRDWAGDRTAFQRETIEAALAHGIRDKAEAAYRRSTALEKRRKLMQAWADYCAGIAMGEVISLHG